MLPHSLQDLASFAIARHIWSNYIEENKESIREQVYEQVQPCLEWKNILKVEKWMDLLYYSKLADVYKVKILHCCAIIEKEISRWRSNIKFIIHNFDHVAWTPCQTIDRVRSHCKSKHFQFGHKSICECCFNSVVDNYRANLGYRDSKNINKFFGPYSDYAILFWHWYGRDNRTLTSHLNKYNIYYKEYTQSSNIFKISVFLEYEVAAFHYWYKLQPEEQVELRNLPIPLILSESDNLEFIKINEPLPIDMFSFFWKLLTDNEKLQLSQFYFLDFYRYMLFHKDGLNFLSQILENWNPAVRSSEYFKLLRLAADTNNIDLFVTLWQRKLAYLSHEDLGHLMWTLLLGKDTHDYRLSVMIINDFQDNQKIHVLNELDKRIEFVKCDFTDKIEHFLTAASLEHLRVSGFPRNPRPKRQILRDRRKHYNDEKCLK